MERLCRSPTVERSHGAQWNCGVTVNGRTIQDCEGYVVLIWHKCLWSEPDIHQCATGGEDGEEPELLTGFQFEIMWAIDRVSKT
jgi:hypothetical protein